MINLKLQEERKKATFNVAELTILIDGSKENVAKRKEIEKHFLDDKVYADNERTSTIKNLDEACRKSSQIAKYFNGKLASFGLQAQFIWDIEAPLFTRAIPFPSGNPLVTHESLFVPTIENQGTEGQKRKWLSLINDQKMFGSYAQTELGHGDNVQALETTATYDFRTKEFVINSPTTTSIKCYAAGLARSSTHAIIMAKLILKEKNYGMHLFVVQLRNMDDHKIMKGITVGCTGSKLGMQTLDNGYLQLNNVRIPRENMLMKNAKVEEDGSYVKLAHQYSNYGTLSIGRVTYSGLAWSCLSSTVTIAVRYSAVRQQGTLERGKPEVEIINYQTQQYKLLPSIALSYLFLFAIKQVNSIYYNLTSSPGAISEFHALSSGMKAVVSTVGADCAESCRRACGGIGYFNVSGLPMFCTGVIAVCTYEGDNTVLLLQTARYLMKMCSKAQNIAPSIQYLFEQPSCKSDASLADEIIYLFELTSHGFVHSVYKTLSTEIVNGTKEEIAWNNNTIALERCAFLHIQTFIMQCALGRLRNISVSKSLRDVLQHLFELVGIYWILRDSTYFVTHGKCSSAKISQLNLRMTELLTLLRPNMVPLVDAFDFPDAFLHSAIGCYDGRVYERIVDCWNSINPMNEIRMQKKANL